MNRILIYDGDCSMCTRSVRMLSAVGWVPRDATIAYGDLAPELGLDVLEAGIHSEIVTLQLRTPLAPGQPATGLAPADVERMIVGAAAIFASGAASRLVLWRALAGAIGRTPLPWLITPLYRTIALNRRIIAPAKPGITCACDPPFRAGYRVALVFASMLFVSLCALLLALSSPAVATPSAIVSVLAAFNASALPALFLLRGEQRLDALAHGALALAGGGVVILGFALLGALGLTSTGTWSSLMLIVPLMWTAFLAARRFALLGVSPLFTLAFGLAAMGGAQLAIVLTA